MEAYATTASPPTCVGKLSHQLFSLLESRFLGGWWCPSGPKTPARPMLIDGSGDRVSLLAIDGCGAGIEDALLAAAALARLEVKLRNCTGDLDAHVADFFNVAVGAGAGGVLATMLFLRGTEGRPRYSAQEALAFIVAGSVGGKGGWGGWRRRWAKLFCGARGDGDERSFWWVFGDAMLRNTVALLLVHAYAMCDGSCTPMPTGSPSPWELARVTVEDVAVMLDESVAMAFGHVCGSNYVRIQASKALAAHEAAVVATGATMLAQRNVESVLFRGRRLLERTNTKKVDVLAAEMVKEQVPPASERGHETGRHAVPVVGDHCFVGHCDNQDGGGCSAVWQSGAGSRHVSVGGPRGWRQGMATRMGAGCAAGGKARGWVHGAQLVVKEEEEGATTERRPLWTSASVGPTCQGG